MVENEFLQYMLKKHYGQVMTVMNAMKENNKATINLSKQVITLETLQGVFLLLLIGLGVSCLVFLGEACTRYRHTTNVRII